MLKLDVMHYKHTNTWVFAFLPKKTIFRLIHFNNWWKWIFHDFSCLHVCTHVRTNFPAFHLLFQQNCSHTDPVAQLFYNFCTIMFLEPLLPRLGTRSKPPLMPPATTQRFCWCGWAKVVLKEKRENFGMSRRSFKINCVIVTPAPGWDSQRSGASGVDKSSVCHKTLLNLRFPYVLFTCAQNAPETGLISLRALRPSVRDLAASAGVKANCKRC